MHSFQPVSYQAGVILSTGMALFDLFFIYAVDLLSQSVLCTQSLSAFIHSFNLSCSGTVTSESHSPIMITIPSYGENGGKQSLATLDIIVPGGSRESTKKARICVIHFFCCRNVSESAAQIQLDVRPESVHSLLLFGNFWPRYHTRHCPLQVVLLFFTLLE